MQPWPVGGWWEIHSFWTSIPMARRLREDPCDSALGFVPGRQPVSHSLEPLVAALKRDASPHFCYQNSSPFLPRAPRLLAGIMRQIPGSLWDLHGCNDTEIHKRDPRDMPSPIAPNFALSNLDPGSSETRTTPDPPSLTPAPLERSRKAAAPPPSESWQTSEFIS